MTRRKSTALAGVAAALAVAAGGWLLHRPSAAGMYDRVRAGMTAANVQAALGGRVGGPLPADAAGRFLHIKSEALGPPGTTATRLNWEFYDGLLAVDFDAGGVVTAKTLAGGVSGPGGPPPP